MVSVSSARLSKVLRPGTVQVWSGCITHLRQGKFLQGTCTIAGPEKGLSYGRTLWPGSVLPTPYKKIYIKIVKKYNDLNTSAKVRIAGLGQENNVYNDITRSCSPESHGGHSKFKLIRGFASIAEEGDLQSEEKEENKWSVPQRRSQRQGCEHAPHLGAAEDSEGTGVGNEVEGEGYQEGWLKPGLWTHLKRSLTRSRMIRCQPDGKCSRSDKKGIYNIVYTTLEKKLWLSEEMHMLANQAAALML
eukprot:gi/632959980/ref/XP_007895929.1/ PREDICTED: uncharacterized protein LOC103181332 [Callorhinchus milii]